MYKQTGSLSLEHIIRVSLFITDLTTMANDAYNMESSCREGYLEGNAPFESTKSSGIYDQIHD